MLNYQLSPSFPVPGTSGKTIQHTFGIILSQSLQYGIHGHTMTCVCEHSIIQSLTLFHIPFFFHKALIFISIFSIEHKSEKKTIINSKLWEIKVKLAEGITLIIYKHNF